MFACRLGRGAELRLLEERHADEVAPVVARNRERLSRWLPWATDNYGREDVLSYIRASMARYARNGGFSAGIWVRGRLAGAIGVHEIDWPNRQTSLGYWLDAAHERKGLVTRACSAVITHLFEDLELNRVEIRCATGNRRSCAIPRRLGFRKEGVIVQGQWVSGRPVDLAVYGILRSEWKKG